jgi:hypothetical protein
MACVAKRLIYPVCLCLEAACPPAVLCYSPARFFQGFFPAMSHDDSHFTPGSMDISAHKRGYLAFLSGAKWTVIFVLGIVVFMAIFRTHN